MEAFAGRLYLRRKSDFQINSPVLSMNTEFSIGFIVLEASVKSNLDIKRMSETRLRVELYNIYCYFDMVGCWSLYNGFRTLQRIPPHTGRTSHNLIQAPKFRNLEFRTSVPACALTNLGCSVEPNFLRQSRVASGHL